MERQEATEEQVDSINEFAKSNGVNRASKRKMFSGSKGGVGKGRVIFGRLTPSVLHMWRQQDRLVSLVRKMPTTSLLSEVKGLGAKQTLSITEAAPTVFDLIKLDRDALLNLDGVGAGTIEKVRLALHSRGIEVWKVEGE
jgi:hypothetical protein